MGFHSNSYISKGNDNFKEEFDRKNFISSPFDEAFFNVFKVTSIFLAAFVIFMFISSIIGVSMKNHVNEIHRAKIYTAKNYRYVNKKEHRLSNTLKKYDYTNTLDRNIYNKKNKLYKELNNKTSHMDQNSAKVKKLMNHLSEDESKLSHLAITHGYLF